jgi:hypothetical protein
MGRFYITIISYHNQNAVYLSRIDDFLPPTPAANATSSASTDVASSLVESPRRTLPKGGAHLRECEDSIVGSNLVEPFDFEACLRVRAFQFTRGSALYRE